MAEDKEKGYVNPLERTFTEVWRRVKCGIENCPPKEQERSWQYLINEIERINPSTDEEHLVRRSDILDYLRSEQGIEYERVLYAIQIAVIATFIPCYEKERQSARSKRVKAARKRFTREWKRDWKPRRKTKPKEIDWTKPPPEKPLPEEPEPLYFVRYVDGEWVAEIPGERAKGEPRNRPQAWLAKELIEQFISAGFPRTEAYNQTQTILREFLDARLEDGGIDAVRKAHKRSKSKSTTEAQPLTSEPKK